MAEEKSPRDKAEELYAGIVEGKAIADIFGDSMRGQYTIAGKTLDQWQKHFSVTIPKNPDVAQCRVAASTCGNLFHEASFYYAIAEAMVDAIGSGHSRKFSDLYATKVEQLKAQGGKLPSADTIKEMVNSLTNDSAGAFNNAKIQKNFWKRILESLSEVRKNIEIATWNNSTEQKMDFPGSGNIPKTPNRGSYGGQ